VGYYIKHGIGKVLLQNFTPRDGIVVSKADGVSIENLTVCNYLAGPGGRPDLA
jgi:hypothetical protein